MITSRCVAAFGVRVLFSHAASDNGGFYCQVKIGRDKHEFYFYDDGDIYPPDLDAFWFMVADMQGLKEANSDFDLFSYVPTRFVHEPITPQEPDAKPYTAYIEPDSIDGELEIELCNLQQCKPFAEMVRALAKHFTNRV